MSARRSSKIWSFSLDELKVLVKNSVTYKQVLNHFGLENKGENFKTLRKRMLEEGIDFSHFKTGRKQLMEKIILQNIGEILVENSSFNRTHLKAKLLKFGFIKNVCYICAQAPEWNGKPLTLQLDHINGISNDNRLENLRMLCPHCHSQTGNFAGRSKKLRK